MLVGHKFNLQERRSQMKKLMKKMYLFLLFGLMVMPLALAEGVDPALKVQVIGIMVILIPPLMGLIKKIKNLPAVVVPFLPMILGALVEVGLVVSHLSDLDIMTAITIGMGVGGVASSGYDAHKKIKEALEK